ncbi:hypothetical protein KK2020170_24150 [Flavobacterium okayamense]|uniref:Uncharacterized protein n=1 Tax=Flavobacterium okayamense TaxID=2830782 RepID=A0ABN6I1J5_9FLAO|nr:hypothetical protein KK2020170_24150 [Flavobacterium okayamense]
MISKTIPRTNPTFPIFDPTTFPTAISGKPSKAAFILTIISGADVANETIVKPTIILDIFNRKDKPTDDFNSQLPPTTSSNKPRMI